jgi:PAS domain S-box-containing protein
MRLATKVTEIEYSFETLANKSPVGFYIVQDGKFRYTNPTFQNTTGYREDELLGRDSLELIVPEDREMVRENAIKMLKGGLTTPYQFRVTHKSGSIRWVMESVAPIQYHRRRATLGYFVDITEREQTEETIQAEKNKLQSLIDALEYTLTIQDTEYNIIYQNEPSRIASGGDHLGEKCYRAYEGRETVCDECPVEKAFKDGKSHTAERRTAIAGKVAFWENTASPIRDAEGKVVACLELARNITERKQQEQMFQAERNKLQSIIDAMGDHLTIRDKDYNLIYQAEPSKKIFGDHVGEKCYRVYEGRETICDGCPAEKSFKDGKSHISERKTITPSGEVIFWENTANPIRDAKGRIVSCLEIAKDITERKRAEEEKSALLEEAPIAIINADLKGKITYVNKRFESESGYSWEEIVGKNGFRLDLLPASTMKYLTKRIAARLRGRPSKHWETHFKCKDGRWIWVEIEGKVLRKSGVPVGFQIIARNITERKEAEEVLSKTQAQLSSAVQMAHLGPWEYDAINNLFIFNDAFYELFHTTAEEVGGYTMSSAEYARRFVYPEDAYLVSEEVRKALQADNPNFGRQLDHRIIYADGGVGYVSVRFFIVKDETGSTVRTYGVNQDITERKQVEEALQAEKNKLQSLINAMTDALNIVDTDYNLIYQNEPAKRPFGDRIGEKCYRAFEGQERVCDGCPVEKAFKDGKSHTTERRTVTPSGEVIFWENTANLIRDAEGKIVSCLEIARDITTRKQAEEALQAEKNKLQSLIDAMEDTITIQDTEFNIIYQNEPSRIASGGDHVGEKCYRVYEGRESICEGCPVDEAFKDGKSHTAERRTAISGEVAFWENTANPIRDAEGRVVSCLELARDVTARKKQEQALADELTQHHLLIDKSLDGIVVLDVDARVVEANQRFADMLGYTMEEVRELHTWDWDKQFPPEKILEMGRNVDEKGFHLETKHTRKDGSVIDVDISISGIMYGGQKLIFCIQRDVTERNRTEKSLKESEEGYRELANSITDVFFAMDEHLRYTYWNKASEILTGVRAEDALGKSLLEIFPDTPGLRSAKKVYRNVLRTQQSQTFVNDFDIDGRHYIFEISAYPSRGGISVFARDITERKEMEEAINLQRAHFQKLFDNSPDAILMMDTNDRAIQANKGFETLFGYSNEEVKGRTLIELIVPDVDVQEAFASLHRIVGGEIVRKESVRRRKDGSLVDVSVLAYPIFSNDKLIGSYAIYSNITERKQAAEALRLSEEKYRTLFDNTVIGMVVLDAETMKVVLVNQAALKMFGFSSAEEALEGEPFDFILPVDKEKYLEIAKKALFEQNSHEAYDLRAVTRDGREIWINTRATCIMHEGKLAALISFTDITEQKLQSERLTLADRLASLGELAAGTAHELNNPLTSVIGFSQLLMEKDIPDNVREDVKLINNEAQRAAGVTKNLLTFARKHAPVKQLTQINNIIEDVLKLRAYEQKVNSIEVKKQLAPDLPEIMVDYFQMQQVFLNIVINAEYFMTEAHNRGTLTITTKKHNSSVRISFADDGPGIPEENLNRIFDPFFTTKEPGKGTGLGLSICHGIVAEHGGQIYAKSQLGKGATFVVELPIKSP